MAKKKKSKKKDKKKIGFKRLFLITALLGASIAFFSTTVVLLIGMVPTMVVYLVDTLPGKNKTFTIGVMNFSGCFPFLLQVWQHAGDVDFALRTLLDPVTIVIIYGAAGIGYIIDSVITIAVASILVQKSKVRLGKIEEEKTALETRWGAEVTGKFQLDESGFAVES